MSAFHWRERRGSCRHGLLGRREDVASGRRTRYVLRTLDSEVHPSCIHGLKHFFGRSGMALRGWSDPTTGFVPTAHGPPCQNPPAFREPSERRKIGRFVSAKVITRQCQNPARRTLVRKFPEFPHSVRRIRFDTYPRRPTINGWLIRFSFRHCWASAPETLTSLLIVRLQRPSSYRSAVALAMVSPPISWNRLLHRKKRPNSAARFVGERPVNSRPASQCSLRADSGPYREVAS